MITLSSSLYKLGRLIGHAGNIQYRLISSFTPIDFNELPEHQALIIEDFGDPKEKVRLKTTQAEDILPNELGPKDILVEHLAACINPADINLVQGVYGWKPKLPAVVGNEGVTRVKQIGAEVEHLKPGDLALGVSLTGYWQNYSIQESDKFYKIDRDLDIKAAVQLKVNPCTAYRMIKDFYKLEPGDTIIQNGANSAVGVYVIQLAKLWGFKTLNVIRDRPNREEVVQELKDYGADEVLTETEVSDIEKISPILKNHGKPKLFLNCVGGKNAISCQRALDQGGYSVTYGAMSKQPFSVSATSLIFKDHKYVGFWVSRWYQQREPERKDEVVSMLNEVGNMFKQNILKPKSTSFISFDDRNIAFGPTSNTKYVFSINK